MHLHSDKDKSTIWVEYAVGSRPCSKKFFSRYSDFPLSSKPAFTNGNYMWTRDGRRRTTKCYLYHKSLLVINYLLVCQDSFYGNKFFWTIIILLFRRNIFSTFLAIVIPLCKILIVLTLNLNFLGKSILDLVWLIEWNLITVHSFAG